MLPRLALRDGVAYPRRADASRADEAAYLPVEAERVQGVENLGFVDEDHIEVRQRLEQAAHGRGISLLLLDQDYPDPGALLSGQDRFPEPAAFLAGERVLPRPGRLRAADGEDERVDLREE